MQTATVTLIAKTMSGEELLDPNVTVEVWETGFGSDRKISVISLGSFDGSVTFPIDFDDETQPAWRLVADFTLYDAGHVFSFFPVSESHPVWNVTAARLPDKWKPAFTPLADLQSPRFDPLKNVLNASNDVDLKNGEVIGDLKAKYDALVSVPETLAKAALLNLYAVLLEELDPEAKRMTGNDVPWFNYVRKLVRLDQERFVAEVEPDLMESVTGIVNGLGGLYARQGYSTEPPADFILHYPNIPSDYGGNGMKRPANMVTMTTLKKRYRQGDVQFTVSFFRFPDGSTVHLLDCDMDEHDNIVGHSFDLLRHLFEQAGTNPIYMHEFIEADSADNNGGRATIDLGYTLTYQA